MSKKQSANKEIWCVDSETDPFAPGRLDIKPFIWGAYNGKEYHEFDNYSLPGPLTDKYRCTRAFVDFFKDKECVVYAHNGGKFDWFFLLDELTPWAPLMVINGRLSKFTIGKAEFRDSFNIMPMSLATIQKDEIDYSLFEEDVREKHMPEIRKYLRADCTYLYGMVAAFVAEFGMHLTQAGASVKAWEKICSTKAPSTTHEFYNEIAPYYYGGRVQCFYSGEFTDKFKIVDINSAYPYAMMSHHPLGGEIITAKKLPKTDDEISRCFIKLNCKSLGALPIRERSGTLSFPDDGEYREFYVSGWEFLAARDTGALIDYRIDIVKSFAEKIEFSQYLDHFYKMKSDSKEKGFAGGAWHDLEQKARYEFSKRFLNSLYGKMGANPENYEEFTAVYPKHVMAARKDDYEFVCELGDLCLVSKPLSEEKMRYYHAGISASITGFVRAYLWRAIVECRRAGGRVLYCDTDCLWATATGDLDLHPDRLGAWDVEATCDYGAIAGKKMYAARTTKKDDKGQEVWKTASKGVRLKREEIVEIAKGKIIVTNPIVPTFSLKRGIQFTQRTISRSATAQMEQIDNG